MPKFAESLIEAFAAQVETTNRQKLFSSAGGGSFDKNLPGRLSNTNKRWQEQVWAYYDEIGELHYVLSFIGACLSRCVLTIGIADERGIIGPVFDENGTIIRNEDGSERPELVRADEALQLVRSLRNDIGGQSELLRRMGQNLTGPGELHLVGSPKEGDNRQPDNIPIDELNWEALSTDEFKRKGKDYERKSSLGTPGTVISADRIHAIRIWKSHPRFTFEPDSSIRAVLDVLEELVLLTREVRGETLSRLTNAGLLLVPEEIQWGEDDVDEGSEAADPFAEDMIETFKRPITDKNSSASYVPFVVRAPADLLHPDKFRKIDLSPQNPGHSAEKRKEAVQRFAQGIDLPVEIVTGHMDTKFANAVVIDDALFKSHIEPILDLIADVLTIGFLRPALDEPENKLVVHYDSGELVARPNRAQDAKDLHKALVISDSTLRTSAGFSESDAPDLDELEARVARQQKVTPGQGNSPTSPNSQPDTVKDGPGGNGPGSDVEQGQSHDEAARVGIALSAMTELAVERAIQRAGARLRTKANNYSPNLRAQLAQVPDAEVAVTLGPSLVEKLSARDNGLFGKEFETLAALATRWTGDQAFAGRLRDSCEVVGAKRMFDPCSSFPFSEFPAWDAPVVGDKIIR